jgi:hypothetical protein
MKTRRPTSRELDELVAVLPKLCAADFVRFCDGHWGAMIQEGHVRRLLGRLVQIRAEGS